MRKTPLAFPVIVAVILAAVVAGALSVLLNWHRPARLPRPGRTAAAPARRPARHSIAHYVGAFMPGEPASYQPVQEFAALAGRPANITVYYSAWGEPFQAGFVATAARAGAAVVVQMSPGGWSMADIAAGRGDGYLREFAGQVRAYGGPVFLSFAAEPDTRAHPWGWQHTPPVQWVAAWQHVVTLMRDEGAGNARWLWDMGGGRYTAARVRQYWPGTRYVDWIGINAYFVGPDRTYRYVIGDVVQAIRRFSRKPIILPEVGIGPLAGQAAKIPGLFAGIRRDHLLGLVWFNQVQHQGINHQDWRLADGDPSAIAEFRAGVRSLGTFAP